MIKGESVLPFEADEKREMMFSSDLEFVERAQGAFSRKGQDPQGLELYLADWTSRT